MDQLVQHNNKSPEKLPVKTGPGEALPQIVQAEQPATPEQGEHQHIGPAGAAVQQAYAADEAAAATTTQHDDNNDTTADKHLVENEKNNNNIDVIEKEWVEKAKKVISQTKDNPREQSFELTGMKREYIQKRFGKLPPDNRAA